MSLVSSIIFGPQVGREIEDDGIRWMLIGEIKNDCHLAVKVDDPHPRMVYFIHVTEDGEPDLPIQ